MDIRVWTISLRPLTDPISPCRTLRVDDVGNDDNDRGDDDGDDAFAPVASFPILCLFLLFSSSKDL